LIRPDLIKVEVWLRHKMQTHQICPTPANEIDEDAERQQAYFEEACRRELISDVLDK